MKKTLKVSGSDGGFKAVASRKKRKGGVLKKSINNSGVAAEALGACSWSFETGDTTKSESIDMEEECLVEETSVDYGESGVNGFGGASTPSKFGGIICATFTSEEVMMAAARLANNYDVVVNTNLMCPSNNCTNQAIVLKEIPVGTSVEAVHTAVFEFETSCAVCKCFGYTSLSCQSVKDAVALGGRKTPLSAQDQFRLARIYAKKSAPISRPLAFGGKTWASVVGAPLVCTSYGASMSLGFNKIGELFPSVVNNLELCLVSIKSSLVSLTEQIRKDIVIGVGLDEATSDRIDPIVDSTASPHVVKLEKMLDGLSRSVLSLSAHFDMILCEGLLYAILENNIVCWHKDMNNLVLIFTETKLRNRARAGVVIIMNRSLARHVYKVSEIPGHFFCIKLLFKNKLSVSILGLYAGANEINFLIARAMNEFSFVILGGNFNKDDSHKCASFKNNSQSVAKTIDYVFVSSNLVNAIMQCDVFIVSEHFNMDHKAVSFNFKGADEIKWNNFKSSILVSVRFSDLDTMWCVVCKVMTLLANEIFKKKWFKGFDEVFTKDSSKFHKLELLVSKIVKALHGEDARNFVYLMECWSSMDNIKSLVVQDLVDSGAGSDRICSAFFSARKSYHASKLTESLRAKKANIKSAIDRRMESFEVNKSHIIRSVLEHPFCKVVLDHLVVNDDLILEPDLVKSKVFSNVMCPIGFNKFFGVVSDLPDDKAAGLSGILNKLWKHCNNSVLNMLLLILNLYLSISMISKPYEWEGVLTNTYPIVLIETAHKILSKIFFDRISSACSAFNVLHGANFSVLKSITTQSPIFAIGLVVEDALKKNRELWLVLQDILIRIKMYSKFIHFFGNIYNNCTNWVMTNFGLIDGYYVHDSLDQGEKSVCGYRLNSYFISKNGCAKSWAGHSFFFAAGAFVDDTIWVGSSQNATQHILNIASKFFQINNISINNDKTVAIPINSRVSNSSFSISGLLISVAKKGESYQYLGIFLSTEGLFKSSLVRVYSDVCFFINLVLKKAVSDKQFLYLVLAVLHSIVSFRTQFSFVSVSVCNKWDALIHKGLKLKSGLLLDFPSNIIHHPSFYGLKSFSQCQSEGKIALLISFANSDRILGHLFASMVYILFDCKLSLGGFLASSFWFHSGVPMSVFHDHNGSVFSWRIFKKWKRLDSHGPVPEWFNLSVAFLVALCSFLLASAGVGPLDICDSNDFVSICDRFSQVGTDSLFVYMDGSLKNLDTIGCRAEAVAFFEDINLGLGVGVHGLLLSTLMGLQTIALALECVSAAHSAALDVCKSESNLIEHQHIRNVIHRKNLRVNWHKIKGHFGISGNDYANSIADTVSLSDWYFSFRVSKHFLLADGDIVSGNSRHFVYNVFHAVCYTCWEVSSGSGFLNSNLHSDVNWLCFSKVWHPDLHMAIGFTSRLIADTQTYFMKHIYNKCYPSVLCLYCEKVEVSNHVFSCVVDDSAHCQRALSGLFLLSLGVLQLMSICVLDFLVFSALYKGFVFNRWLQEAIFVFHDPKVVGVKIADFVHSICLAFRNNVWLIRTKHHVFMEKNGLISVDDSISISISGLVSGFSIGVIKLLGIAEAFGVHFGFCKSCVFFLGISDPVSVNISA
ncbi:hypothetical protein G9A89_005265 [Geosiphon pyriformis]|nr:hypothetical protein G9A89_005265 [Geosiphon pyriformis]